MLPTKFRGNRLTGFRVEVFSTIFTIYGHGGHHDQASSFMSSDFHFIVPESFHTKFYSDRHSSF